MKKLLITLCASSLVFNSQAGLTQSRPVQNQSCTPENQSCTPEMSPEELKMAKANALSEVLNRRLCNLSDEHDNIIHNITTREDITNFNKLLLLNMKALTVADTMKKTVPFMSEGLTRVYLLNYMDIIGVWVQKENTVFENNCAKITNTTILNQIKEISTLNTKLYDKASELETIRIDIENKIWNSPLEKAFKELNESPAQQEKSTIQQIPAILGSNK